MQECWPCSGLGLQQENVNSPAGTREGPQPLVILQVQTGAVLLLPAALGLCPPMSPVLFIPAGSRNRLQPVWGVPGVNEHSACGEKGRLSHSHVN